MSRKQRCRSLMNQNWLSNRGEIAFASCVPVHELGIRQWRCTAVGRRHQICAPRESQSAARCRSQYLKYSCGHCRRWSRRNRHPSRLRLSLRMLTLRNGLSKAVLFPLFFGPTGRLPFASWATRFQQSNDAAGVPCVPGSDGPLPDNADEIMRIASNIGYPIIIKATAGGGGKGMRVVHTRRRYLNAWQLTRSEAQAAFGNDGLHGTLSGKPRHVEFQVLADTFGTLHLGRPCLLTRRHRKSSKRRLLRAYPMRSVRIWGAVRQRLQRDRISRREPLSFCMRTGILLHWK